MNNRISNEDIMKSNLTTLFKNNEKADVLYSDPPWGEANLKYWRTINNQKGYAVNWFLFLKRLKILYQLHVNGPLALETGKRFINDLINVFGKPIAKYICIYGNKKLENILMCWGEKPKIDLSGKTSIDLIYSYLISLSKKPTLVFDPCVGLGNTTKACKKCGIFLYANELNINRMNKNINIMDFELC